MPLHHVSTESEFDGLLSRAGGKLVIVDFYADWCGPCKAIAPVFERLSDQHTDALFVKVNEKNGRDLILEKGTFEVSQIR